MKKNNTENSENKRKITRVVQIALATDQVNAIAFVPSSLLHELPEPDQIDVIELRLVIDRHRPGVRVV